MTTKGATKVKFRTPAYLAREAAGLTVEQAAKRARICLDYLKRVERPGNGAPFVIAERLSRIYGCGIDAY